MKPGVIYVGYQGVGKSTVAKKHVSYIDLESGNFWVNGYRQEDWYMAYCAIAKHLIEQGKNVFLSSHEVVRNELKSIGCPATIICPSVDLKDEWVQRLFLRYKKSMLEKDFRAYKNAVFMYEQNINALLSDDYFGHLVIDSIPYDLYALLRREK